MNTEKPFYQSLIPPAVITVIILLIPLIAMQFSDEVLWTTSDFVVAGLLLFIPGSTFAVVLANKGSNIYKVAMGIAIATSFLLVWVNLAVGLVGHEGESINLLYFGVLAIGLIGAFLARFRAPGMSYTLFAMVTALVIVTIIALMGYLQEPPHNTAMQILGINAFFAVLFSLSAISFRRATQDALSDS